MPEAARVTDTYPCSLPQHVGGKLVEPPEDQRSVVIGGQHALGKTDKGTCQNKAEAHIVEGSGNVYICKKQAARVGDPMDHGLKIASGCLTVKIGGDVPAVPLLTGGAPLVEPCEPLPPKPLT